MGFSVGLKTPEKLGWLTSGGRKKKCLFPVAVRPSEKSASGRPGEVVGWRSLHATITPMQNTPRKARFMGRLLRRGTERPSPTAGRSQYWRGREGQDLR